MSEALTIEVLNAQISDLKAENADLRAGNEKLLHVIAGDVIQVDQHDDGTIEAAIRAPKSVVMMIAGGMIEMFDDAKGPNFCGFKVRHPERGDFEMVIQRVEGKTPNDLRIEAIDDVHACALTLRQLERNGVIDEVI